MVWRHHYIKLRKKVKKYKLSKIFDITDMFNSVLDFLHERDKLNIYNVSKKIRAFVLTSKFGPILYKFNNEFFFNNIKNEKVLSVYKDLFLEFSDKLTKNFLKPYCICISENNCIECDACKIFGYNSISIAFCGKQCCNYVPNNPRIHIAESHFISRRLCYIDFDEFMKHAENFVLTKKAEEALKLLKMKENNDRIKKKLQKFRTNSKTKIFNQRTYKKLQINRRIQQPNIYK